MCLDRPPRSLSCEVDTDEKRSGEDRPNDDNGRDMRALSVAAWKEEIGHRENGSASPDDQAENPRGEGKAAEKLSNCSMIAP